MQKEIFEFYSSLRQIFILCPSCGNIHRLSDCKLFQKNKSDLDWKEKMDKDIKRLEQAEEKLTQKITEAKEAARHAGRRQADKEIRKYDPIFSPLKLNCNDSKVIFHPVDFIVFNGMNNNNGDCTIKEVILLDKGRKSGENIELQKSIEKAINKQNYEWITLRVTNDGKIKEE